MVLILLALVAGASAAPAVPTKALFEAGVSAGSLIPVSANRDIVADGALRRVDAGVGLGPFHIGGFTSLSLHNATDYFYGGGSPIAGDFQLTRFGASARWAPTIGRFVPSLRGEVAAITFLSPFDETSYDEQVLPTTGNNDLGITSTGLLIGGGADAAFAIIPDHAWAGISVDGGFSTLPGFGVEVGVRVGLSAAL